MLLVCKRWYNAAHSVLSQLRAPRALAVRLTLPPGQPEARALVQLEEDLFLRVAVPSALVRRRERGWETVRSLPQLALHDVPRTLWHRKELFLVLGGGVARLDGPEWEPALLTQAPFQEQMFRSLKEVLLSLGPFVLFGQYNQLTVELRDPRSFECLADDGAAASFCIFVQHDPDTVLAFRSGEVLELRAVRPAGPGQPDRELGRVLRWEPIRGTDLVLSIIARSSVCDPRSFVAPLPSADPRGGLVFLRPCLADDNFFTEATLYRHPGQWSYLTSSGVVPIRLRLPLCPAGSAWLCSVLPFSSTVAFLRPSMAYWAAVQFPEPLEMCGAPLLLRDAASGVQAWEGLVLLFGDASVPSFLRGVPDSEARVTAGRPVPLPPHLPRPKLLQHDAL